MQLFHSVSHVVMLYSSKVIIHSLHHAVFFCLFSKHDVSRVKGVWIQKSGTGVRKPKKFVKHNNCSNKQEKVSPLDFLQSHSSSSRSMISKMTATSTMINHTGNEELAGLDTASRDVLLKQLKTFKSPFTSKCTLNFLFSLIQEKAVLNFTF